MVQANATLEHWSCGYVMFLVFSPFFFFHVPEWKLSCRVFPPNDCFILLHSLCRMFWLHNVFKLFEVICGEFLSRSIFCRFTYQQLSTDDLCSTGISHLLFHEEHEANVRLRYQSNYVGNFLEKSLARSVIWNMSVPTNHVKYITEGVVN